MLLDQAFLEAPPLEEEMWQKALFGWNDMLGFPMSHFPLSRPRRGAAGHSAELEATPVSRISFHGGAGSGTGQLQFISPLGGSTWLKAGEPGEHAPFHKSPKNASKQAHRRARERTLFRRLNTLSLPAPAWAHLLWPMACSQV